MSENKMVTNEDYCYMLETERGTKKISFLLIDHPPNAFWTTFTLHTENNNRYHLRITAPSDDMFTHLTFFTQYLLRTRKETINACVFNQSFVNGFRQKH